MPYNRPVSHPRVIPSMSDRLLLRLASDGGLTWLRQGAAASEPGMPPASALQAAGEIVVLVPSEDVLLTEATLRARTRAQLLQALPYAVEEQLLDPVEDLHFAATRGEGALGVAVVAKATLRGWLERLAEAGIEPDVLLPDALALPSASERSAVLIEDGRALVRLAPWSAFACSLRELPDWLARMQPAAPPKPLDVHDVRVAAAPLPLPAARLERGRDAPAFLAAALAAAPAADTLNLLEGEFAPRRRQGRGQRWWRTAAALAAAVALLAVADLGIDVWRLSRHTAQMQAQAQDALRKAFPDIDAAMLARSSPEQLMRGRLDRLRGGAEASGLLRVLGQIAPVLGTTTRIQTRGMEYRNGTFELALRTPDVAALDSVRERLALVPGLKAEVTAANPGADGVDGRIRIGGGAP